MNHSLENIESETFCYVFGFWKFHGENVRYHENY